MRPWVWALLLFVLAGSLAAQATPRTCDTAEKANFRRIRNSRGEETIFIQGPTRFLCTGGVQVRADSAVWRRTTGELELIRHVFYRDSTRTLSADWANFLGNASTLFARGSVLLTDLESGSVVRGQRLQYEQETQRRPVARAIVEGGRPHAILYPTADTAAPGAGPRLPRRGGASRDTTPPIEVDADWMEFLGTGLFRAKNNVVIVRGKTDAYADSAEFDQTGGRLSLRRAARVVDPQFRLAADSIDAYLTDNALRDVEAVGQVQLHSEDLQVTAPRLSIGFLGGQFQDMRAWVPGRLAALAAAAPPPDTGRADTAGGPPQTRPDTARRTPAPPPVTAGRGAVQRPDTMRALPSPDTGRVAMIDTSRVVAPDTGHVVPPAAADTGGAKAAAEPDTVARTPSPPALPPGAPAARWGTATAYADSVRAVAIAKEFRLQADSIHAVAPDQELDQVIAIGQGYGVRLGDSVGISLPPEAAHDWVQGDTIIGYFAADTTVAPAPGPTDSLGRARAALMRRRPLPGDTTTLLRPDSSLRADSAASAQDSTVQRTLEKVIVIGGSEPARSLYRIRQQDTTKAPPAAADTTVRDTAPRDTAMAAPDTLAGDTTGADTVAAGPKPGINYMTARRITLHLKHGQVQRVEAEGPIQGVYLDPIKHTERPDTTGTPKIAKPNG